MGLGERAGLRRRTTTATIAAGLAVALAAASLAGCGSSGDNHQASKGPGASGTAPAVTKAGTPTKDSRPTKPHHRDKAHHPKAKQPRSHTTRAKGPSKARHHPKSSGGPTGTVAPVKVKTLPPVRRGQKAHFGGGVTVQVTAVKTFHSKFRFPGDIAGPAVAVSLVLTNGGRTSFPASGINVVAEYGKAVPAGPITDNGYKGFSGTFMPGSSKSGTYAFSVPSADVSSVLVYVAFRAGKPVATLRA